jgi:hypothetical protein
VTLSGSQQAVVDYLAAPSEPTAFARAAPRGPVARKSRPVAESGSVRIAKSRAFKGSELHAVLFVADSHLWRMVIGTVPDETGGWKVHPVGGGSGGSPRRERPWVNLTAQFGPCFRGGGEVIGQDADRARLVRMRFANGTTLEDSVEDGVVLFEADHAVSFPAEVQVLDATGELLASYAEFEDFTSDERL